MCSKLDVFCPLRKLQRDLAILLNGDNVHILQPNASHQRAGARYVDFKTDPTAGSVACVCYLPVCGEGISFLW
jgi:hypothetical protein